MRHEHEYMDDEYPVHCRLCGEMVYGGLLCGPCEKQLDDEAVEASRPLTKSERRQATNFKGQYGPIRHLPGDFRPAKTRYT